MTLRSFPSQLRHVALVALVVSALMVGGGVGNASAVRGTTTPARGGKVVYGLEAENGDGWCLPEAVLALSGIQVARTIYDSLTVPDGKGDYKPYLAESVTPNVDFTEWTIALRPDITFHDGSALDATVVKNNLDAYRGAYPGRSALLFAFIFDNIADVSVVDPLTVKVTMKTPWVAFPAYLFFAGRVAIVGQAQLDDPTDCDKVLIGTGPFQQKEWVPNDHFTAVRNRHYWQKDADGKALPYLDEIEYRPIPDEEQRVRALESGQLDLLQSTVPATIDQLRRLASKHEVTLVEPRRSTEVGFLMFNVSKPPFDTLAAREAVAYAFDSKRYNDLQNGGLSRRATGPFAPGTIGYLKRTGLPTFDLEQARKKAAEYKQQTGQDLAFTLSGVNDPISVQGAQLFQQLMEKAGIDVQLAQADQTQFINQVIGGEFQATGWVNDYSRDPDVNYVWWHGGSPVNFGQIADADVDRLLEDGRANPDPEARKRDYQELNRLFAEKVYNLWQFYLSWDVATATNVHGVLGPDLPDGSRPWAVPDVGHPVLGLYASR